MKSLATQAIIGACLVTVALGATPALAQPQPQPEDQTSALAVLDVIKPGAPRAKKAIFVSADGDDANPGTKAAPFKTLYRAQEAASFGDVVYIRGGVYDEFEIRQTDNVHESVYHYVIPLSKSGITYAAYPGDPRPIFDFSKVPTDQRVAAFYVETDVSHINFVGFDVTGVKVGDQKQSEAFRIAGGANVVDVAAYDNEATAFYYTLNGTGAVINSDAYRNVGPTRTSAGNSDGFGAHAKDVWFINNRAWANSDDGFDSITSTGRVVHIGSWAFLHHGNQEGIGDRNGFKVGGYAYRTTGLPDPIPSHTVIASLAVDNGGNNFYANHQPGRAAVWLNNTASDPGYGANFNMLERVSPTSPEDIPGYREVLHNNLAYRGPATSNNATPAENETNNSWTINGGLTLAGTDFVSVDMTQLTGPRGSNASLPDVDFLRPAEGSTADRYGLGYLADEGDPAATLGKLVQSFVDSGDITDPQLAAQLLKHLDNDRIAPAVAAVKGRSSGHMSDYAATTLILVGGALTAQ